MLENTSSIVLTPSALFAFLSQIEELKDVEISIDERDNEIVVEIGDSTYVLECGSEITSDVETVDEIDEINEAGYDEVYEDDTAVEGGIIKELIKTLAIGGLVRLTKSALTDK